MSRTIRRGVVALGAAALLALTSSGVAHADVTQLASGVLVNSLDIASYALQATVNNTDPDITCSAPTVAAGPVTPAIAYGIGEVYGNDVAVAHADCLSLQGHSYLATLVATLQYQPAPGAPFADIPGCLASTSANSFDGEVSLTTPPATCQYDVRSVYYDKPHRGHAVLTTTESPATYEGASPTVWNGGLPSAGDIGHD
jgi:ABC-type amino acid transport substrate-binding protein